jgi:PAS domain S-box-containing protein
VLSTRLVWSLYPALDAALLALLLRTVATRRHRGALVVLIAAGVACWLVADVAYLATGLAAGYSIWLDAGWLLGGLSMAVVTWQPSTRSASDANPSDDPGIGRMRIAVALIPLLVPPAVLLNGYLRGTDPSVVPVGVVTVVLVALAYARALHLLHDATEARAQVRSLARFNATLAANSSDAVVVLDADGRIVRAAPQLPTLVGLSGDAPAGRSMLEFVVPRDLAAAAAVVRRALQMPGQVVDAEVEVASPDGETMWLAVRLRDLRADPDVGGVVCNLQNITPRKLAEAQLSYQAFHDELTGLPNRDLFLDRLGHALRRTDRTRKGAAVVYLDLDGFRRSTTASGTAQATPSPGSAGMSSRCSSRTRRSPPRRPSASQGASSRPSANRSTSGSVLRTSAPVSDSPSPTSSRRPPRCSGTPTSRCTRPRRPGGAGR